MQNLLFILWDQTPEIWPGGPVPLRWYGLFFAMAFFLGQIIITHIFKTEGKPEQDVDSLTYHMVIATIIGARLGHCLFYQPDYYLANPIEILKIWEGGLASHGATIGIIVAMWLYARKRPDQSWLWILDRIVIVVALGGSLIRLGNLMNSEIVGKPADLPWAMVFANPAQEAILESEGRRIDHLSVARSGPDTTLNGNRYVPITFTCRFGRDQMQGSSISAFLTSTVPNALDRANQHGKEKHIIFELPLANQKLSYDDKGLQVLEFRAFGLPRHPAMVYESISTFILFLILFGIWKRYKSQLPEGRLFSIFVVILFTLRFLYEFLKENQVDFESSLPLNMGQILSIPMVAAGLFLLVRTYYAPVVGNQPTGQIK